MFEAELQLQVAAILTLAHTVVGAIALLPDELQLLAHRAAVQTLVAGVPAVCVVVGGAGHARCLPPGRAVLFQVGARRTLVACQLARRFWVIMQVLGRKGFLDGAFNGDVQKQERAVQQLVHCGPGETSGAGGGGGGGGASARCHSAAGARITFYIEPGQQEVPAGL